ncbi:MAG: tRNA lysidine(34) synthetase TilS [Bacteroidales bacterium]|nr:tRNA lysidine(34) synthetase TilS [Bacteroidales bacterium]
MEHSFLQFIKNNNLFKITDKILLAVSAGIDSVVMADIFFKSKIVCSIAHCNFHLRDNEANEDEIFVKNLAEQYKMPFYKIDFNTKEFAKQHNLSLQMAARDLRYEWFEKIRKENDYQHIAIAHNKNDSIETFLINIARGTGIKGLTGIKPKSGKIVRPVLFAYREDIEKYAKENSIEYREDSSNKSLKYHRNKIRHQLIPIFKEINPNFEQSITDTIQNLKETDKIFNSYIEIIISELIEYKDDTWLIKIESLKKLEPLHTYLFEILKPFAFSKQTIRDISNSFDKISGKTFFSDNFKLIKDRNYLIIKKIEDKAEKTYLIEDKIKEINEPVKLKISLINKSKDFKISSNPDIAYLDYEKLFFPLSLKKWGKGDKFIPLGMKTSKKLSDFFIDNKLSIYEKENTWILLSNGKIVWIIGYRIDDRFKITEKTRKILIIEKI